MLIYAPVIRDSPWNQSSADTVYNFLKVLILYETKHIISKILKVKNCLAHEKMIAHGLSACDLPYVLKKNLFSFSNTHARSVQGTVRGGGGHTASSHDPSTNPGPFHIPARWAARFVFLSQEVEICLCASIRNMSSLSVLADCHLPQGE